MQRIDSVHLSLPVSGLNLGGVALGELLTGHGTLLVFLRHLGCLFCREMVADLRRLSADPAFPPTLLVMQSPIEIGQDFFAARWPDARVIADPQLRLYKAFDVPRATATGMFGPPVWTCVLRAAAKGNRQDLSQTLHPPHGDAWLLSAMFLATGDGAVTWFHRAKYAGDRPDYLLIPRGLKTP